MNQLAWSLPEGQRLKEYGMQRAFDNESVQWKDRALSALERFCGFTREFAGEDFRIWFLTHGGTNPHVHNVWPSIIREGQRRGWIIPTGRYVPAKAPATRAHPVRVYQSLIYREAA